MKNYRPDMGKPSMLLVRFSSITCMRRRCKISRVARWYFSLMVSTSASRQKQHVARSQASRSHHIVGRAVSSVVAKRHRIFGSGYRWVLSVLRYHIIRVNYPYPFLGVIFGVILHDFIRKNYHKNRSNRYLFS